MLFFRRAILATPGIICFPSVEEEGDEGEVITTGGPTTSIAAATTVNFTNLIVRGTAGKLMTIGSITAATHTLSKAASGVVDCDYLSVSQSIATGGATFFAGDNSTDGGSNTGWIFKKAPNFLLMF